MSTQKEYFINSINLVEVDQRTNIPTVLFYGKDDYQIGYQAYDIAESPELINDNFKVELGNQDPTVIHRHQFVTASGETQSAHSLTKNFVERALQHVDTWINVRGLNRARRILVSEPIAMGETEKTKSSWLTNYRAHLRRILTSYFDEIDFLPEPFAVFQYYRYGIRHPLVAQQIKHAALVLDFGGGTFDVSLIETTNQGDISAGGRNAKPLAAASVPVGGFFINKSIAELLLFEAVDKNANRQDIHKALKKYDEMRNVSNEELGTLRADYRNFIRHFKHTVYEVEKAKIAICSTIANWQLDATYQVPPAYQVKIPREPFREDPLWATVRLDVYRLRDVFERKIWNNKLKPAICDALTRATSELNGKPISIILLSGGSSNIRWLAQLLKRDLKSRLPEAEILELQENFQEIVAKGLAVECARRTYNDGKGDFRSMTYNRLYLALAADEGDVKICRFKSLTEGLPSGNEDGVLLPAASVLSGFIEKPIKWRVSLQHPPRRALDYYFMRTSFDYKDTHNVHNVDHRVYTPKGATFSKPSFQVELTVKDDGTTTLKFIYREARPSIPPIEVRGQPFYLDMTFGSESAVGQAYLGFDFGTSNSAFSFVEQAAIRVYSERGRDSNWRELSDLVSLLPYPVASPLAKYIAETNTSQREWLGLETFEALLCLAAYTSYAEYCCMKGRANAKLFKSLSDNKRSAGPLWVLLRESLKQLRGHAFFSKHYFKLIEEPLISDIDQAVTQVAQFKHGKESAGVDYVRILSMLGNITYKVFADQCFGAFESVTKQRLRKEFSGYFRCARGASPPFIELHEYSGKESFSEEQIFVCNPASGKALLLTPLMLWLPIETNKWTPELQLLMFDNGKKGRLFEFKATEKRPGLTVNASVELEPIF